MLDLVANEKTDEHNAQRAFWTWVAKQKWRKMLPQPVEYFS